MNKKIWEIDKCSKNKLNVTQVYETEKLGKRYTERNCEKKNTNAINQTNLTKI